MNSMLGKHKKLRKGGLILLGLAAVFTAVFHRKRKGHE